MRGGRSRCRYRSSRLCATYVSVRGPSSTRRRGAGRTLEKLPLLRLQHERAVVFLRLVVPLSLLLLTRTARPRRRSHEPPRALLHAHDAAHAPLADDDDGLALAVLAQHRNDRLLLLNLGPADAGSAHGALPYAAHAGRQVDGPAQLRLG